MTITLRRIKPEAGNAATFIFELNEPFAWQAGQSIKIAVPGPYGPMEHRFTISSAPTEKVIAVTTRPSNSDYKQSLFALTPGDSIDAFALEGTFTWQDTPLTPVFIAAGIGITPFHSIIKERVLAGKSLPTTLIYGVPAGGAIFKDELDKWAREHPSFTVQYVVGERVGLKHVKEFSNLPNSLLYLSGPSAMVDDLSAALLAHGVPESQVLRDWFIGRLPQDG